MAQAEPSITVASAEPAQILTGQASTVRFSADIAAPSLIAGSVNLLRVGLPGTNPTIVGKLHDDGINGDAIAGDGRYSIQVTLNEPAATQVVFRISAAFKGLLRRVTSADIDLGVLANRAPVAVAGPNQAVAIGRTVTLDGRQSFDPDGDQLAFAWTLTSRPPGSSASLDSATLVKPSFNADVAGTYRVTLVVNDGQVGSVASEITVQAYAANVPPTAVIGGELQVPFGTGATATASLNANASADPEGGSLSYAWRIVSRPAASASATLQPFSSSNTVLTADKPGLYVVELTVNDGALASEPVQATITFYQPNTSPSVSAGPDQVVTPGAPVQLNGVASDPDAGDSIASFAWAFIARPGASTASLQNASSADASFVADVAGDYLLELVVTDSQGAQSRARVLVRALAAGTGADADSDGVPDTLDTCPATPSGARVDANGCAASQLPALAVSISTAPPSGTAPLSVVFTSQPSGGSGGYIYNWAFGDGQTSALRDPTHLYNAAGTYNPTLTVTDILGSTATASTTLVVSPAVILVNVPNVIGQTQVAATSAITAAQLTVGVITTAASATVPSGSVMSQSPAGGTVVARGLAVSLVISTGPGISLPPDPANVAQPIDPTVATSLFASTAFLYSGANPIQTGVAPGTIEARRAAVLRGKVQARNGSAVTGVTITILNQPQFGQTLTRADGAFDLAVNGGGQIIVDYQKPGFLPVQRQVNVPWQDYVVLPDVVMIPVDSAVTTITMNAAAPQVARGNATSDADGTRRATLLVPQGTTANLVLPNGTTQPVTSLNVRATEYTVGANGPQAMPAPLPPTSGYTYAVELSADEAITAGATSVVFNQPIASYTENFLGFPVGTAVPSGFYDRVKGTWVPSENGRVIKITAISGGVATVDSVGTGTLRALVLSDAELAQLATLYGVGQELWRVPIAHLTPWDYNLPFRPPSDATGPQVAGVSGDDVLDKCVVNEVVGSIIECQNQVLGERVGLVGTPFTLNYRSARAPGRNAARTLRIPLSGASVPASLKRIELDVQVAGRSFQQSFTAAPNQQTSFTWDGLDVYGRAVQGAQPASISIDYVYDGVYTTPADLPASFAAFGGAALTANLARTEITISQSFQATIGPFDARGFGLGGWGLSGHQFYDPHARVLHFGDGGRRGADSLGSALITTVVGNGVFGFSGDGGPASQATLRGTTGVAVGPDGSLYLTDDANNRIRRVGPDGVITTVAGNGIAGFSGDGGLAVDASLRFPAGVALALDGSLYIADNNRIRRVGLDGIINTVVGNGVFGFSGDGGPATQAALANPSGVAVAADGSLYFSDEDNNRIRRVGPDGIITTVAGNGVRGFSGDGGLATQASLGGDPDGIALGPDGSLYITDDNNKRIRRVGPDGIITTVAGNGVSGFSGDGGLATLASIGDPDGVTVGADGSVYIADDDNNRVRRVGPGGIITTVAGNGASGFAGDGGPATRASIRNPDGLAVGPDGSLYLADNNRIRRVAPPLPGFAATDVVAASEDGSQLYVFDGSGRHLRTLNALTNATLLEFGYDTKGRLAQVIQKTGGTDNVMTIEHDAAGNPTAIVAPFGQRTTLAVDANGFLASIRNPAGEQIQLASTSGGLLTSLTDPRGKTSTFTYDSDGRLVRDADPAGGVQNLARTVGTDQFTVARTTALARTTTYKVEDLPNAIQKRTVTAADGTQVVTQETIDAGATTTTASDGTVTALQLGPDPQFGMQSPVATSVSVALPGGPTLTAATTRTAVLTNPLDPLSLSSLTGTSTVDGRTMTSTYTAATRTEDITTPAGRTGTISVDTLGRPVQIQAGGLAPAAFIYDSRGRLATMTQGSGASARTFTFVYNPQGFVQSISDPIGRNVQYSYDTAGRVISKTMSDGSVVNFGYDANGNIASLTPPGRPAHTFDYSDRDELTAATPPAVAGTGATSISYNVDRQYVTTARPDNRSIAIGYDSAGRPIARTFATGGLTTGTDTLGFDSAGRVASVAAASGVTTNYAYAGSLLTGESWAGSTVGSVTRTYDSSFRLASQSVNGGNTIAFGYDSDSLLISAGALTIIRDPQHGLATGSTLGTVGTTIAYNSFGETSDFTATASATSLYDVSYVRDGIGRIQQKTETIGGVTDTYVYTYDLVGQLTLVTKNGTVVESYGYDSNGNRTTANVAGSSIAASYDAQDRLTSYGAIGFGYTAAGELSSRTAGGQTTTYQYDALGNLLGVTLPSGTAITYVVDGRNRRVGKRIDGTLVQGLLYGDALRPVAELDGAGAIVSRFVYAGRHVPAYMIRGGVEHRIVTDQVGSVRLVVNAATGAISQRIDYDTFGNVTVDTNPGFQPFGFAGGIYDTTTGLVRFGARDYDPQVGRWTAKDPIGFAGGDANLYRYVRNNPVNLLDRTGKQPEGLTPEEIAEFENARTGVTRAINPETGQPMETAGEFAKRRNAIGDRRRAENRLAEGVDRRGRFTLCGGIASTLSGALGLLDFVVVYQRSLDSGRSFLEELNVQATDIREAQAAAGIHTTVNFFGPFLYVEGGNSAGPSLNDFGSI